ncbi:MAG: 2-amino-4-hydroxy-6-hydroxymethyldihydropteridine diphosphokinase [Parachlamydiaceae bacterium]|nr:2-amino-4-hydroxy-6-hydroxymethyldihydropteridine diphosphokinase [Parachlamydiaceae bacterium]
MNFVPVYLGLGGNIGDTQLTIIKAIQKINKFPNIRNFQISRFYQTSPVGDENQASFINCVCRFDTNLDPFVLLTKMQDIERGLGKVPKPRTAPRIIDIDILFYGDSEMQTPDLEIPHPRWKERLFVLIPLQDLTISIKTSAGECVLHNLIQNVTLKDSTQKVELIS